MGAISATQHLVFIKTVKKELAVTGSGTPDNTNRLDGYIEQHLQDMEQLHVAYIHHLEKVQSLIQQYEALKKQTRILLRKRLAAHKRQSVQSKKIVSQPVRKAS